MVLFVLNEYAVEQMVGIIVIGIVRTGRSSSSVSYSSP